VPNPIFVAKFQPCGKDIALIFEDSSQSILNDYANKFLPDVPLKVIISKLTKEKVRSLEQNNYYWGVVLKILAEFFGYIGPGEKEDLHNELRSMFLVRVGRLGKPVVESTTKLSTEIFERYLEAIRTWAKNEWNVKIPLPNEAEETDTYRRI
jgi:hypothetical protein